jgi:hypothetical protein
MDREPAISNDRAGARPIKSGASSESEPVEFPAGLLRGLAA